MKVVIGTLFLYLNRILNKYLNDNYQLIHLGEMLLPLYRHLHPIRPQIAILMKRICLKSLLDYLDLIIYCLFYFMGIFFNYIFVGFYANGSSSYALNMAKGYFEVFSRI